VSVGQLDQFKSRTDLVLTEAGPHVMPIIYGPDTLADPCH
ncbi:hypothetical protein N310_04878, partial [Acanthisitta chloris]